jgi:uncharacterized protein
MDLSDLLAIQALLVGDLPKTRRFLYEQIRWEPRLTCLYGGRGVGKTTLMLQRLADEERAGHEALYFAADHIQVAARGIYEIAAEFFRHGGDIAFIDEAHKRPTWAQEIKSLYDSFPRGRMVVSGSSVLALQSGKTDLSRRAVYRRLPVLSFREYLGLVTERHYQPFSLATLLADHVRLATTTLHSGPILGHFNDYLERGAYPFVLEGEAEYLHRLDNVIERTLYEDLAVAEGRRAGGITAMKKLLWLIATSPPTTLNIEGMARDLGVSRPTVYSYLENLDRAGLLLTIPPHGRGARLARRDSKLCLENTNILTAISRSLTRTDPLGTLRETFFANQMSSAGLRIRAVRRGDFIVEDRYTFEIGGKGKGSAQVAAVPDAYVARDGQEVGFGRTLPLWLFGFLY